MPAQIFSDPGDTFEVYTSIWIEKNSQSLITYYNDTANYMFVDIPYTFTGRWTIAIAAKDSAQNVDIILFQITIKRKKL